MIEVFKKIWKFAGDEQWNITKSIILGFINAIFYAIQFGAIFVILDALLQREPNSSAALTAFLLMVLSVVGRIITQRFSQLQRVHAGYFMVGEKRIYIGDKLKIVPMGYFNQNNLGDITAVTTTTLGDVENSAPVVLVTILGGILNTVVFALAMLLFDWRMGLIMVGGVIVFLLLTALLEKKSTQTTPFRQEAQATLVEKVLETVQGMSVVKSFNLDNSRDKKVHNAIKESCVRNMAVEAAITPIIAVQQIILNLFSIGIILASICFYLNGSLSLVYCLMMLIFSFMVFEQLKTVGAGIPELRISGTSIDRANGIDKVPVMDEGGENIVPQQYDICFKDVSFAYEKRPILKRINLTIPEKTTTAIVGPSGCGKTTLCNLISRFWDVDSGAVSIGGRNVKDYTLDSLICNISMVFQHVYLFQDTIENNIKFGKPDATHEEVVEAAKKACCDDFIQALPDGYNTVLDEGGSSLSGGEKQRISIARAMLKDAPIVIFDEATANVDPENEDRLQAAIEALTHDKTIIMIAHRLKTVRHADQILVLDKGEIVQQGIHHTLISQPGIYADFVMGRKQATGWKICETAGN
jgi:ATP-binding cassette subfamily B protein